MTTRSHLQSGTGMLPNWRVHPGRGPYLLLVHGFLCSRAQWRLNLEALSEVCRPVTVELLGHHLSHAPETGDAYLPDAYVAAFDQIRQLIGTDRWFVFGYSLGGGLTLRYALTHPDRVIGHGLSNSTSAMADDAQLATWRSSAEESARGIIGGGLDAIERIAVHPKHARRIPPSVSELLLADARRHTPRGIANTIRYTSPYASVREMVQNNRRPALLTWGTRERRFTPYAEFAQAHLPQLTVARLECGHGVNMEAHEAFNAALVRFIRDCCAAPSPAPPPAPTTPGT